MPDMTKIIEALRERGDDTLANEVAAEFGAAPDKDLLVDLGNLEDFVLSLGGINLEDKRVISSSFKDLTTGIQRLVK